MGNEKSISVYILTSYYKIEKANSFCYHCRMSNENRPSVGIGTQPIGMSYDQTVQDLKDLSINRWGYWNPRSYLLDELRSCDYGLERYGNGWRPELGPFVVDLAKIAHLSAQRFLEHVHDDITKNPAFDVNAYGKTTLSIYRTLGKAVGDYYTLSYPNAINAGISPQAFHDFVQASARDGGKVFAKWMAWAATDVLAAGGNLEEFELAALKIREKGGVRLVKPFAQNASDMILARRQEVFMQDFEELSTNAIDTLGKDATYWLLRVLPKLVAKHKVNPFDFYQDMVDMATESGQVAVKQYLGGLSKNLETLGDAEGEGAQERLSTAYNSFVELRGTSGNTAAAFFAFRGLDMSTPAALQINERAIALFRKNAESKVFHATAWFGSKIDTMELPALLRLIGTYAREYGAEKAIEEVKYAAGVLRRGGFVAGFPVPHSRDKDLDESGYEFNDEELFDDLSYLDREVSLIEGIEYPLS